MKTKIAITIILFFTYFVQLWSCSCLETYSDNFCGNISSEFKIVTGVVVDTPTYYLRSIQVIDVVQGITPDTSVITILGQDGLNCGEYMYQFSMGDSIIVALQDHEANYAQNYYLHGCHRFYLRIENGKVTGPIHGTETEEEYDYFVTNLNTCNLEVDVIEKPISEIITISPTLSDQYFLVQNLSNTLLEIVFYNQAGQVFNHLKLAPFSNEQIDTESLPAGVFFAAIRRENQLEVKKLIKI